ncbi:Metalloprotease [Lenzites betulinus]|nr:Metalloprotease [Lenzites betulinus]
MPPCFLVLVALIAGALAQGSIFLELSGPTSVANVEDLKVVTAITNTGDLALKILNDPSSPLSNLPTDTFTIINRDGASPEFIGIAVKYAPHVAASSQDPAAYTHLAPGQSHKIVHDLSLAYNFSTSGQGQYNVSVKSSSALFDISGGYLSAALPIDIASKGPARHVVNISGSLSPPPSRATRLSDDEKCADWQQKEVDRAIPITKRYVGDALAQLTRKGNAGDEYKRWFGSASEHRFATVASHFEALDANNFTDFTFVCNTPLCSRRAGLYAYTYPDEFGTIYVCDTFFRAPVGGPDSRASTIVHESSHFTRNGATLDHAYGQTLSRELARSYPDLAVMNADNHEYFSAVVLDDLDQEALATMPEAQVYIG